MCCDSIFLNWNSRNTLEIYTDDEVSPESYPGSHVGAPNKFDAGSHHQDQGPAQLHQEGPLPTALAGKRARRKRYPALSPAIKKDVHHHLC
ncbi:unnamed protein product [Ixodes pacificus]